MLVRRTFNGVISTWHEQLDGKLIDPARCICLNNDNPELGCPIDTHAVKARVMSWGGGELADELDGKDGTCRKFTSAKNI